MQRFELIEGSSSKFWEVDASETSVTVRYGKIGTNGQTQTKSFDTNTAAVKERDKLIKEKTGKGYKEVGVAATATLAAVAPKAKAEPFAGDDAPKGAPRGATQAQSSSATSTAQAEAKAAPTAAASASSVPAAATSASAATVEAGTQSAESLDWPRGGFQWTKALEELVPIVRGIHAPPYVKELSLLSNPLVIRNDNHYTSQRLSAISTNLNRAYLVWDKNTCKEKITRTHLMKRDDEYWLELITQAYAAARWGNDDPLQWVAKVAIAVHGVPFTLDKALTVACADNEHLQATSVMIELRHAIASATDEEHQAAFSAAEQHVNKRGRAPLFCAYLFPHHEPWVTAAVATGTKEQMLGECVLSVADAVAYAKRMEYFSYYGKPCVALQVKVYGERAMPLIQAMVERSNYKGELEWPLECLLAMHTPEQIDVLIAGIEQKETRLALDKVAAKHPACTLYSAINRWHNCKSRTLEGWTIRFALREEAAYAAARAALSPSVATAFASTLANLAREDASTDELPPLLISPPWSQKIKSPELPTLELPILAPVSRLTWDEAKRASYASIKANQWVTRQVQDLTKKTKNMAHSVLELLSVNKEAYDRALKGESLNTTDLEQKNWYNNTPEYVLDLPDAQLLQIWNAYPPSMWSSHYSHHVRTVLARTGEPGIPAFARWVASNAEAGLDMAMDVESVDIAPTAIHAFKNLKKAKAVAERWMRKYPETTVRVAFALAFGRDKVARDNAQFTLRWLLQNGFEQHVTKVAQEHDGEAPSALEALKAADPLNVLPSKMPKLPSFFVPAAFSRPELASGAALPLSAAEHIGTMLAISRLDMPYLGIEIVKQTLTRDSLAEFAWDLFEAWLAAGSPSKEGWAFAALGLLGNDETARRLTPKIREWPGEAAHARAVTGLDVLAAIGSDMALMHLNAIANKVKFKGLQDRAKEKIAAVAEARGFTTDELADRLVPDLGLDESAALTLDFGPRQFSVSFDETLKPFVRDSSGARLKDLPKPIKSDDAALAEAATERFKQLKKDAKATASSQVTRLELAMIGERRWSAADFKLFFIDHPVMRFLATRVVWGVYREGAWVEGFRVAEDYTLADSQDTHYTLAEDVTVGIAHVLNMPKASADAFGQILGDYEILQPFKQLGREVYNAAEDELKQNSIKRYASKSVATGSVMGLINRGWERGQAQDAGWIGWFTKRITPDIEFELNLDPGMSVGYLEGEPTQKVTEIFARKRGTYDKDGLVPLSSVSPVLVSEVLRDIDMLAPYVAK